jgi:ferredoxin
MFDRFFRKEVSRRESLVAGHVVPDSSRCVQCSICTYNCPIGIDVRMHAWRGEPVKDSYCLTCGECVRRCPRGVLRLERTNLFAGENEDERGGHGQ